LSDVFSLSLRPWRRAAAD